MPRIYRKKRRTKNKNTVKVVEQETEYKIIEPCNIEEKRNRDIFRYIVNQKMIEGNKNIPHCVVCGDTEEDGGMKKVDNTYFCDTCFMIQVNMDD